MANILENTLTGIIPLDDLFEWLKTNKSENTNLNAMDNYEFLVYFLNYMKENCSWLLARADKINEIVSNDKTYALKSSCLPMKTEPSLQSKGNSVTFSIRETSPQSEKNSMVVTEKEAASKAGKNWVPLMKKGPLPQPEKSWAVLTGKGRFPLTERNSFSPTSHINQIDDMARIRDAKSEKQICSKETLNKKVQVLTLGCAPYQLKRKEKNLKNGNAQKTTSVLYKPNISNCNEFPTIGNNASCSDLNSFEAFPPLGAKVEDTKARRRITPTPVQMMNNGSSKFGKPHFELPSNKVQSEVFRISEGFLQEQSSDLQHERELLKQTRGQLSKPLTDFVQNDVKSIDIKDNREKIPPDPYIIPDPLSISMIEELSVFIDIYGFLLTNCFVTNITSELYFLFELITAKVSVKDIPKETKVFSSLHNCVYFATSILCKQGHLLYLLDNTTLTSLLEIPYLCKFSPQLVSRVQLFVMATENSAGSLPSLKRVPFRLDDDSRINFPDESSFICFKKQRDLFYELLRDWQDQAADSRHQERFTRRAKQLINLAPGTLNMYHLARLIQSQLIASCMCFEVNEVYDEVLNDMQKNYPEKFKKLQERFLTPSRAGGLVPPPSFYGIQGFFSELIVSASSPILNQHLLNIFVCKILEMNNIDILSDGELSSLGTLKEKYIFLLHTLRLLGKFLGYLQFLPYSYGQKIPSQISECHLESRKYDVPPLDLPKLLKKAIADNHVILTVPWVVEYLSLMDPLAVNLEYIQESLKILIDIYKWDCLTINDTHSVLFLHLIIGWLLDVLQYPKKHQLLLQPISTPYQETSNSGLDTVNVIDKQLIHSCCPYLIEFKILVFNFINDMKYKREARKITPLSTTKQPGTLLSSKQKLELELEENFFSLHSSSLKKTSDFIAERMASKAIGKIRSDVTKSKLNVVQEVINMEQYKEICASNADCSVRHQQIQKLVDSSVERMYNDIHYKVGILTKNTHKDIKNLLSILLPDDTNPSVIEMCGAISFRLSAMKITDWCDSNLLLDAMKSDIKNKIVHLSKCDTDINSNQVNIGPLISKMKLLTAKIHSKPVSYSNEIVSSVCDTVIQCIDERTPNLLKKVLVNLSVDLCIALIVHFPDNCCDEILHKFSELWLKYSKQFLPENLFLCPQNIRFLQMSKNFQISCEKFVNIIKYLLNNNVFDEKELKKCLESLSKFDWQDEVLQMILKNFTDNILLS
ncbi:codanin-1-like [Argiope bruennichi]|uniref:codanin-1-like n=1 Tax=Argiope bruennichi TaxID=94029 RepID=UPI00249580EA|nr:codanin-1-like [Argiope bruennichi]